jgi:predicted PhzF superfamily epimerase YddE/YHI9
MDIPIYVVDAFTEVPFRGNPAGICPLGSESLSDKLMAQIAAEMKHAETAFLVPRTKQGHFDLRWFTPEIEVDLCGHATLAAAHLLWEVGAVPTDEPIAFHTRSGELGARRQQGLIELDFPAVPVEAHPLPFPVPPLGEALFTGNNGMDWLVELGSEADVRAYDPDMEAIRALGLRGLIVTGSGQKEFDFVSRFFAPLAGIPEDPVTGSAHCALAPYWAQKLRKNRMSAYQASSRGGEVGVELRGERVSLFGKAVTVLRGKLSAP